MSTPAPEILLFARGVLALFDLWPALTIAVQNGWGGPESVEKKTWLLSELVELFEERAVRLPSGAIDPSGDEPLSEDQVAGLLEQVMGDEFEALVEDNSIELMSADIVRCWRDILAGRGEVVDALERRAAQASRSGVKAHDGGGEVEVEVGEEGEWESEDDDDDENEEEAPQLVEAQPQEPRQRQGPVIDDDGFEMVQSRKSRRR
ncbi:hypothetical protein CC85DRAFT_284600 [Cutaneotrichosporon oleaginosum]|uniref:Pre-rRNA-processing protein TSR2 n=1 Tax=Cutaneotrichosporon oleaginosum TaxID=879819 RepID=A0A0J0XQV9_9TREE|nr:uncharacterized protein CC85DRAFT_284600 [Cutaneotrichosporon oleaginosum]KLT43462.1 hypothetical protein CC85DRAFT_284600 [Cutaneotrichosporon oleaginosum]TXT05327.1 hypothetical protein COLE_06647 [Cutaneotrichosporon oleaginosum]